MKKIFALILAGIFALAVPAHATVKVNVDGVNKGHVNTVNYTGGTVTKVGDKITVPIVDSTMIAAGATNGGATSMASTTTAVPVGYAYVNMAITTADPLYSAKTLANGKKGQIQTIHAYTGSSTTTITPATSYGWSVATFNAVDDQLTLMYLNDTDGWIVLEATSVSLTP